MFLSASLSLSYLSQKPIERIDEKNVCKSPAARCSLFSSSSYHLLLFIKKKIKERKGRKEGGKEGWRERRREEGVSSNEVNHCLSEKELPNEQHYKDIPSL